MRRAAALSLGIAAACAAVCAVACAPSAPPAAPAPVRHVDPAAFGALDGPDALVFPDSGTTTLRPVQTDVVPAYARDLLARGTTGAVALAFVVDGNGRPVPATAVVLTADSQALADAVCRDLPRLEFEPEIRDGRLRRALVVEGFGLNSVTLPRLTPARETPMPDVGRATAVMRTMPIADVVRLLVSKPACPT